MTACLALPLVPLTRASRTIVRWPAAATGKTNVSGTRPSPAPAASGAEAPGPVSRSCRKPPEPVTALGVTETSTVAEFQITWAIVMAALTVATFRLPVAFTAVVALVVLALVLLIIGTLHPSATMTKAAGYVCFAFAGLGLYLFLSAASVATGGRGYPLGKPLVT